MIKVSCLIISLALISSVVSAETLSLKESEKILSSGKILNSVAASAPLSENPEKMFSYYSVVYKNKFYICYSGIWPRGKNIKDAIGGIVLRCTNGD